MMMLVAFASKEFSISSLTTDAGRSMTSPAAILLIKSSGRSCILGMKKKEPAEFIKTMVLENARWLRTKCGVNNNSSHFLFKKNLVFLNEKSRIFLFRKLANRYESRKAQDEV